MVGNNRLFSYYECKTCNKKFGGVCEDSFGKYILPFKIVSEVYGKKKTMCYSDLRGEIRMNKAEPILPEFNDTVRNLIKTSGQGVILNMTEYGFDLNLQRKRYTPEWVYFTLVKMALSIMPYDFISRYAYTIATLRVSIDCVDERQKIFDSYVTPGFIEYIPDTKSFANTSVELFLRKENAPTEFALCHFCLNFGHYSLQIPMPEDYQHNNNESIKARALSHFKGTDITATDFHSFEENYFCPFNAEKREFSEEEISQLAKSLGLGIAQNISENSNMHE